MNRLPLPRATRHATSLTTFLATFLATIFATVTVAAAQDDLGVVFNRDIQPILAGRCFSCHGPDPAPRKGGPRGSGGLRLDIADGAYADLGGRRAIVPGKPAASELLRRIRATDKDRMPPARKGPALSPREIALLEKWIASGAHYAPHWSFVAPRRPPIPEPVPPSALDHTASSTNPIDRFVARRLRHEGLHPQSPADPLTLIRRVTLDLTGLPPTPTEAERFAQESDPTAYAKVVDRLLDSSAFGEHQARQWLDLARYADSAGYADDPKRTIWAYRDWVIRAFNGNMPFDEFTVQQIAGDLLPAPEDDQLIATAFHRNTMTNSEGGTDDEEFRSVAIVDRVNTTMAVWMGTTMACAQCHDHKYDPLTQEEYFRLYAFLNTTEDSDKRDERPVLAVYDAKQKAERARLQTELAQLRKTLETETPGIRAGFSAWDAGFPRDAEWHTMPDAADLAAITALRTTATSPALELRVTPRTHAAPRARFVRISLPGKNRILSLAEVQVFEGARNVAPLGTANQSSSSDNGPPALAIDGNTDGHFFRAKSTTHTTRSDDPWWQLDLGESRAVDRLIVWNRTDTDAVKRRLEGFRVELLDADREIVFRTDVSDAPDPSVQLDPGGAYTIPIAASWQTAAGTMMILARAAPRGDESTVHVLAANGKTPRRLWVSGDTAFARFRDVPADQLRVLQAPPQSRTAEQQRALRAHYLQTAPELQATRQQIAKTQADLDRIKPMTTVPILREQPAKARRVTHVHMRGNFLQHGKPVSPGVPAVFPPLAPNGADSTADRLAFARWLVSPQNPLTARVIVNRLWESLFGIGLVATSDDFGIRGTLPSHPELLDWLATEFVRTGWDVKQMLRLIVTSATYRQSSNATVALRQRDPQNQLLARGPRRRLSAEMIRDQALAVSGLLSPKLFGPPVRPPRPNLGLRAAFGGSTDWRDSTGEDRYRRGIYTFWQRSIPYPSMAAFDAPSREVCTIRRLPTNTPLQALVTLNDPAYVEAAQALARRIVREGGGDVTARARFGFRLCAIRPPTTAETDRLTRLFEHARSRYRDDPDGAQRMATDPLGPVADTLQAVPISELAAWTVVANVLLNLDEGPTKQ